MKLSRENGVAAKIITGDHLLIAHVTSRAMGIDWLRGDRPRHFGGLSLHLEVSQRAVSEAGLVTSADHLLVRQLHFAMNLSFSSNRLPPLLP